MFYDVGLPGLCMIVFEVSQTHFGHVTLYTNGMTFDWLAIMIGPRGDI
jgi:hypothetical protein